MTIPVQAATQIQGGARDEQRALDEVVRAQIDLNHGHRKAAMHRAAKAETLLLNAQQGRDLQRSEIIGGAGAGA